MTTPSQLQHRDRSNMIHFRFLGLKRGECRVDVIRKAAFGMSTMLSASEQHYAPDAVTKRRSEIAVAAYRLLDPRRRPSRYERVQLCYPLDRDDVEPSSPNAGNLLDSARERSRYEQLSTIRLMRQPVIHQALEEELDTSSGTVESETSWLDERREIVRSLRNSEDIDSRGQGPLGWIRSLLGL